MNTQQAEQVLRQYNAWRRYDGLCDGPDKPDPFELGEAIDVAVSILHGINKPLKPDKEYYGG